MRSPRVLILIQALDARDPLMGFFVTWMRAFLKEREAIVCGLRVSDPAPDLGPRAEIHRLRAPQSRSRIAVVWNLFRLSWRERRRYDAVYIRSDVQYAVLAAWFWRLLGKKTVLWYAHHVGHRLLPLASSLVDHVVTSVPEAFPSKHVEPTVIGQGIDTERFAYEERTEQPPMRVLVFGRISRSKHLASLMDTFVASGVDDRATLTVRGPATDGAYTEELMAHANGKPSVAFIPREVAYGELQSFFASYDVLLNANVGSLDKSILEAGLTGVIPIAASGGIRSFLPEELFWLHAKTADEQSQALKRLAGMSAEERHDIRERVRSGIRERHSLSGQIRRLLPMLTPTEDGSLVRLIGWALVARLAVWFALLAFAGTNGLLFPDSHDYLGLAQSMLHGQGFALNGAPFEYRTIGYPLLLAAGLALFRSTAVFVLLQLVIGSLIPVLTIRVGRELGFPKRVRRAAAWITALEPHLVFYSCVLLTEVSVAVTLLWTLLLGLRTLSAPSVSRGVKTGILFGVNLLIKPLLQLSVPFLLVGVLFARVKGKSVSWKTLAAFLITAAVVISPWLYRNQRVFGTASLSSQGPAALAQYLSPSVLSTAEKMRYQDAEAVVQADIERLRRAQPDAGKSAVYLAEARAILSRYPLTLMKVLSVNVLSYWTSHNYAQVPTYYHLFPEPSAANLPPTHLLIQGRFLDFFRAAPKIFIQPYYLFGAIGRVIWLAVSIFVLLGFLYAFRRLERFRWANALVFGLFLYFTMTVWVNGLGVEGRLRYPLMPLEFLYASYAFSIRKDILRELLVLCGIPIRWLLRLRKKMSEVTVLFYHSISDDASDPYAVSPAMFQKQMTLLQKRANIVPLTDVVAYAKGERPVGSEKPVVAITFDDGYATFATNTLPILKKLSVPSTLFVCADPDQKELGNAEPLLTRAELVALGSEPLVALGSHAFTHRKLTALSDEHVKRELADSKRFVEEITKTPCRFVAYPKGAFDERVKRLAESAGYEAAFTIKQGLVHPGDDRFRMKRVVVQQNISLFEFRFRLTRIVDWSTILWKKYHGYGR